MCVAHPKKTRLSLFPAACKSIACCKSQRINIDQPAKQPMWKHMPLYVPVNLDKHHQIRRASYTAGLSSGLWLHAAVRHKGPTWSNEFKLKSIKSHLLRVGQVCLGNSNKSLMQSNNATRSVALFKECFDNPLIWTIGEDLLVIHHDKALILWL